MCLGNEKFSSSDWTLYLGGGTPSLGGRQVAEFLAPQKLAELAGFLNLPLEATFEVNPESYSAMTYFKNSSFDRVSIGVQSFNDRLLSVLGRLHDSLQALQAVEKGLSLFRNVNVDLIYGIPGQTVGDFLNDVTKLLELGVPHISIYPLSIGKSNRRFDLPLPPSNVYLEMYLKAHELLTSAGYVHYEISNFARDKSFVSLHNLNYWLGGDYIGAGPSAHSRCSNLRWANSSSVYSWDLEKIEFDGEPIQNDRLRSFLIMRIYAKFPISYFRKEVLEAMAERGFIKMGSGYFNLTALGWFSYNRVFEEIYSSRIS